LIENNNARKKIGELPAAEMRLSELFIALSSALDMGDFDILDHSRRVAYIALEISEYIGLEEKEVNQIVLASLIHDIGIDDFNDKKSAQGFFDVDINLIESHCKLGADLTKKLTFLPKIDKIIYYHHHKWNGNNFDQVKGTEIPLASRIIHLSDRVEAMINPEIFILNQIEDILQSVNNKSAIWFDPDLAKVFNDIARKESFWLNLRVKEYTDILRTWGKRTKTNIDLYNLESLASIVAHLIDRVSPFTSRHSTGVATIAAMITDEMNYSLEEQRAIRVAGLFHDLGKLILPNEILEKNSKLSNSEFQLVKQHPYHTYRLLNKIKGIGSIPEWAAFHHERLDGKGYPFKIKGENLNIGSRIMAVSDVFQALTEDRPYRLAFSISKALEIIDEMKEDLKLDASIISILKDAI
jgi:putative nucleotidyltransferase with HDIG domain